jgi:hypothetical protein
MEFVFRQVDGSHPGMQFAMQLISEVAGVARCVGSAFSVAPGLAMTAAHVVDDYLVTGNNAAKPGGPPLVAIQLFEGKMLQWVVDAIYGSVRCDVAFLRFLRPSWWGTEPGQMNPRSVRLNFNPPALGDELRMVGFPQSKVEGSVLYSSPSECICRVSRVDLKTDLPLGFRPLSHIDVDGKLLAGMSGGPCFDKDWNVVGVNSKGWDGLDLAHVALLWPAMRTPIDLFKAGKFPAIDLFKEGPARAIGYRRLYVTSKGESRLAKVDPASLVPLRLYGRDEHLSMALNFAASNAQDALAGVHATIARTVGGTEPLDTNAVVRQARHYFWELETALRLGLFLAARQAGLGIEDPPTWEGLIAEWKKHSVDPETLDALATLEFSWNSVDLFELRTYAELSRSGVIATTCITSVPLGQVSAVFLEPPVRRGGQNIFLPDGLDRFLESSRRFVQELLRLSLMHKLNLENAATNQRGALTGPEGS